MEDAHPAAGCRRVNGAANSISSGQAHLPQLLAQGSHVRQPNTLRPETLQQFRNSEKASLHVLRKESSSSSTTSRESLMFAILPQTVRNPCIWREYSPA